ncbi:MAG: sulfite exporter TauE/SafE family protein [Pseudomonadota bacterium]
MLDALITDPWFYAVAIPAVYIFGVSKGGFGGGLGVLAVPLMSLAVSPIQAAAILLPILCFMDAISVRVFWKRWSVAELYVVLPAAVVGVVIGTLAFSFLSEALIRLIVGLVAVSFTLYHYASELLGKAHVTWPRWTGRIAGTIAGFTSFVAHAGGPPVDMYLLRRPLDKTAFVGTTVLFFLVVNYVKLVPYAWLGQFDATNLATSVTLFPIAAAGVLSGYWAHHRVSDRVFFGVVYLLLLVVGIKLIADGLAGI